MADDDDGKLILYATIGFGAGIYWFFKGFKIFREYRVLADTPEVPIRSMAMGLVEIHGKAKPVTESLVNSPVSGTPCLFYKVDIEKYKRDSKGNGSWSHYKTDCNGLPFYLDDGTGKAMVVPFGAEFDLIQNAKREAGGFGSSGGFGGLGRFGSLSTFGTKRPNFGKLFSGMDGPETPAAPAAIATSVATATAVAPAAPVVPTVPRFVSDSDLIAYALSAQSVVTSGSSSFNLGGISLSGLSLSIGGGSADRFRFMEYCILPDHWYDVTGTCTENPHPKDESDRNMIMKGENEPTFLISWRNEQGIESTLRNRALKYVFGGAALAVACLAFLLAKFGWLF